MSTPLSAPTLATLEDQLIFVEGGAFDMGGEKEKREKPIHRVQLKDFYLSRTLVNQALYEEVMGNNPSAFPHPLRPVEKISWYDAVEFCNRLSGKKNLEPYYTILKDQKDPHNQNNSDNLKWLVRINPGSKGYRLPTEAEWEYAARGGKYRREVEYAGSSNRKEVAWFKDNSQNISQPVGLRRPNALGLYDLSGNLREWCQDWYGSDYYQTCADQGTVSNPFGPSRGSYRVVRGGAWLDNNDSSPRVAYRYVYDPLSGSSGIGFRFSRY